MATHLVLVGDGFRQWCGSNQRWFNTDDVMAGACLVCQAQIRKEGSRL